MIFRVILCSYLYHERVRYMYVLRDHFSGDHTLGVIGSMRHFIGTDVVTSNITFTNNSGFSGGRGKMEGGKGSIGEKTDRTR